MTLGVSSPWSFVLPGQGGVVGDAVGQADYTGFEAALERIEIALGGK
jgi:hypothetical protein